jgi:hypothetical protein
MQCVFGVDQSQTHLLGKPDGIIMTRFNAGTKERSKTNSKAAEKFCIPHDVILEEGDINPCPCEIADLPTPAVSNDQEEDEPPHSDDEGIVGGDDETCIPLGCRAIGIEVAKEFESFDENIPIAQTIEDELFIGFVTAYDEDDDLCGRCL